VTERRPAWIDVLSAAGRLTRAIALPKGSAPSDANAYGAAGLVVADRGDPGRIEEIDEISGAVTWSYGPLSGPGRLDDPAEAEVLPDGDVLVVDSGNDRVIVIDARTKAIIWQYGHTARAGRQPGYLDDPGSATLVPIGP
jgi:DNA-binding beta-propeller fold protein YncE